MTGETERSPSGWTIDTWAAHSAELRACDETLQSERERHAAALHQADIRFREERDRRYAEVDTEREKALKIKETADLAALGLAREIQTYKDEKANELREQIGRERGNYATKDDLYASVSKLDVTIKPLADYVVTQQGGPRALTTGSIVSVISAIAILAGLYVGFHNLSRQPATATVTVTTPATP